MKRVLVTGANGFVGSNIVTALLSHGWFVYAVDRQWDNPAVETWSADRLTFIEADCMNLPDLTIDALVHGAAITAPPDAQNPEAHLNANIQPMLAMMQYAKNSRAIFISSSAVYAQTNGRVVETDPPCPMGLYAVAKHTMETLVNTLRQQYERDFVCIRLGSIYGPHEYPRESRPHVSLIAQMIQQAQTTGSITVHHELEPREWTFAPDIGQAVHALLNAETLNHALYHVAAAEIITWGEVAVAIQKRLPHVTIKHAPRRPNDVPPLTRQGYLDNARLREDIGFADWTPIEAGIEQTIARGEHHA